MPAVLALKDRAADEGRGAGGTGIGLIDDRPRSLQRHRIAEVVPAIVDPGIHGERVGGLPRANGAGECERLIHHRIDMRVEEVGDRRHRLVARDAVAVPQTDGDVVVGHVAVELRHRQSVVLGKGPRGHVRDRVFRIEVGVETAGGGEDVIGAHQQVDPPTPVPAGAVGLGRAFGGEVELVHLPLPATVGQHHRAVERAAPVVGTNSSRDPAEGGEASPFEGGKVEPGLR